MNTVRDRLFTVVPAKGLRETTITSYLRFFNQLGIRGLDDPSLEVIIEALRTLDNPNTPRPDDDRCLIRSWSSDQEPQGHNPTLRTAQRIHLETRPDDFTARARGLLLMYGGLRIGEACATQWSDVRRPRRPAHRRAAGGRGRQDRATNCASNRSGQNLRRQRGHPPLALSAHRHAG